MKRVYGYVAVVFLCGFFLAACGYKPDPGLQIKELTVNYRVNPVGIDENPVFSWKMESQEQAIKQTAYQILVSNSLEELEQENYIWDSGKVATEISVAIPYFGEKLEEEQDYFWQVRVWDNKDRMAVSETALFEMGKLEQDWEKAVWITCAPSDEEKEAVHYTEYDISYDFRLPNTSTGFVWGAESGKDGRYYLWQFDTKNERTTLSLFYMESERVLDSESILLEEASEDFIKSSHTVKISVRDGKANTYVDDQPVSLNKSLPVSDLGGVGLWVARGEKDCFYDNILVQDEQGKVIWEEDFSEEKKHIFSPYYVKIEDGWCCVDDGYLGASGFEEPAPMFRKEFETQTEKEVCRARLYASAFGIYDIWVNGTDICEEYAAPGQSVYSGEVYYRTYDITNYLQKGENTIGFMLGHGRYDRAKGTWGEELSLCAQLVVYYEDGSREVVGTDESWQTWDNGPVRSNDLYSGEYYNANYEVTDWSQNSGNTIGWKSALKNEDKEKILKKAASAPGVICIDQLDTVSLWEPKEGEYVFDFGQNFNGVCQLQLTGKAGETVVIRYAEALNEEDLINGMDKPGTIWNRNLATADNTDYYTFSKDGEITYTPSFAYRGFRYVQVSGLAEEPSAEDAKALVLSTDNHRTGYFTCSDENMNRLYEAIYWSQLSNYVDIPTDCPQRDERLGWTGDAQVYAHTGALYADTYLFMEKYIDTLRQGQNADGSYPQISPLSETIGGSNGWSDAGVILVWEMYQQFGDQRIIEENLEAMCRYADYLVTTSDDYIREGLGYNDHNAVSYPEDACMNTAQCAYVMRLLSKMCMTVGQTQLSDKYGDLFARYRQAWQERYLREDGSIGNWLQSEYVIALAYGLYPESLEEAGAEKLRISVEAGGYHVGTGYVATPHLLPLLCDYGYVEEAYRLVQQDEYPSWNYMLSKGATTLTEGWWTYYEEEGKTGINGSLNHVALGSVAEWYYTHILGIRQDEKMPGYQHFYLEPVVGGDLTYAKGSYDSRYGTIESEWTVEGGKITYRFVIPANTSATVTLPHEDYRDMELGSGSYEFVIGH